MCFGFVAKAVLLTKGCIGYCFTVSRLSLSHSALLHPFPAPGSRAGSRQEVGWDTTRTADPNWLKGCFMVYNGMLSNWSKEKGGQSREGHGYGTLLPKQPHTCAVALLSSKWLDTCLAIGSNVLILLLALFAHVAFVFPIKLSFSQSVSLLTLLLFCPCPMGDRNEWKRCGCLAIGWVNILQYF